MKPLSFSFLCLKSLCRHLRSKTSLLSGRISIVLLLAVVLVSVFTGLPCYGNIYATWKTQVFTSADQAAPTVSGETANPSGDGINNLEKYAFGLDPYVSIMAPPHEIGHQLLNRVPADLGTANGHYTGISAQFDLMYGGGTQGIGAITDSKRLWDDPAHNDGVHDYQIDYLRTSPLIH